MHDSRNKFIAVQRIDSQRAIPERNPETDVAGVATRFLLQVVRIFVHVQCLEVAGLAHAEEDAASGILVESAISSGERKLR
ncbi:hypothetical protein SDC9_187162 [bioreactor metagenome]|uniref:Uncharacterized protein n=1 Tax=bioreactor metagenome TaxID=1076179 RepID=A0A645HU02_9ZZZZ